MQDTFAKFADWLRKPYDDNMSAGGWFAFLGLVLLISIAWASIIRKLTGSLT